MANYTINDIPDLPGPARCTFCYATSIRNVMSSKVTKGFFTNSSLYPYDVIFLPKLKMTEVQIVDLLRLYKMSFTS